MPSNLTTGADDGKPRRGSFGLVNYLASLTTLYLIAFHTGVVRGRLSEEEADTLRAELRSTAELISETVALCTPAPRPMLNRSKKSTATQFSAPAPAWPPACSTPPRPMNSPASTASPRSWKSGRTSSFSSPGQGRRFSSSHPKAAACPGSGALQRWPTSPYCVPGQLFATFWPGPSRLAFEFDSPASTRRPGVGRVAHERFVLTGPALDQALFRTARPFPASSSGRRRHLSEALWPGPAAAFWPSTYRLPAPVRRLRRCHHRRKLNPQFQGRNVTLPDPGSADPPSRVARDRKQRVRVPEMPARFRTTYWPGQNCRLAFEFDSLRFVQPNALPTDRVSRRPRHLRFTVNARAESPFFAHN